MLFCHPVFFFSKLSSHFAPQSPVLPNTKIKYEQLKLYLLVINKTKKKEKEKVVI